MDISKAYHSKSNIHDCYCVQCWRKISVLLISYYFKKSNPGASIRYKPNSVSKLCLIEYVDLDNIQRALKIQTHIYYLNISHFFETVSHYIFLSRLELAMEGQTGFRLIDRAAGFCPFHPEIRDGVLHHYAWI